MHFLLDKSSFICVRKVTMARQIDVKNYGKIVLLKIEMQNHCFTRFVVVVFVVVVVVVAAIDCLLGFFMFTHQKISNSNYRNRKQVERITL